MPKQKNAILLVLPIEEISLRPELSSPPRLRIQGGYPERDRGGVVVAGWYFHFLIFDGFVTLCVVSYVVLHPQGSSDDIDRSREQVTEWRSV